MEEHTVRVLEQRNLTGPDRLYAQNYAYGDVLRYAKRSEQMGLKSGEYVQVSGVDHENNTLTVTRKNGEELTYDPRRLQGVTVYREVECVFAVGDRVQLTSRYYAENLPNRAVGTLEEIDGDGNLRLRMRGTEHEVEFNIHQHPHLDYGYVVTSHSGQGQDFERVLVHGDTEQTPSKLLNQTMAYVAMSRGRVDLQVYTDDTASLVHALSRDVSHSCALEQEPVTQESESLSLSADGMMPELGMEVGH
jgi:ATP-dependent exoDNAse (exonuclease V) alpha subunit